MHGQVIANFGQLAAVRDDGGNLLQCRTQRRTGLVVCGDEVECRGRPDGGWVVERRLPRRTTLARPDRKGRLKPLAANIDQLLIVIAPRPAPDWTLVCAYLAYAHHQALRPVLVLNKTDQLDPGEHAALLDTAEVYAGICPVVRTSCKKPGRIQPLREILNARTSVLTGQSGVGKSSVVKALLPDQDVQTRAVSEATGLGSHTTTTTMLYRLGDAGALIDSPGVRQFNVAHLEPRAIRRSFTEFNDYAAQCRFDDCTHLHEPGCAVLQAVEVGELAGVRWEHYRDLLKQHNPGEQR